LITNIRHALAIDERRASFPANLFFPSPKQAPNCKQVWFAGVHGDVGGGYPEQDATLAKVPLAWMLREAEALGLFINAAQRQYLMDSKNKPPPNPLGSLHESLTGMWWPIEYVPRRSWGQRSEGDALAWPAPRPPSTDPAQAGVARLRSRADEADALQAAEPAD
jgi:uncharacterized protein (DUF2235 family)